tara:strand:- start:1069 stop:1488 length:420 start_codon:yes stop_codon:yes gene_type:complete
MLPWLIQTAIISLVIILILHNIYFFFKENLTTPSVTDYINRPNEKYEEICKIISSSNNTQHYESSTASNMKEELKLFLNQQLNNKNTKPLNQSFNEHLNEPLNEPLNQSFNEHLNEPLNEPLNEIVDITNFNSQFSKYE